MPRAVRTLTERALHAVCAESFAPTGRDRYGIEAEWPTHRPEDVTARPSASEMERLTGLETPGGSRVTFEPGGQVELSTAPAYSIVEALRALTEDTAFLQARLAALGLSCADLALDGRRPPSRVLEKARYQAMEGFFAASGTPGSWMMNNTASTQVNLSHEAVAPSRRWFTLNLIAPLLIAAFANSPGVDQRGLRWVCTRQAIWWATDPRRTRPVRLDISPCSAWLEYALDADVVFIPAAGSDGAAGVGLAPGLPFGRWLHEGHELGWPTVDDFRYHLSMLFPPVRPRGWLELRVLDALPAWLRTVACLVVATAGTAEAGRELVSAIPHTSHLWLPATRLGVRDARIGAATDTLLAVVGRHLPRITQDPTHAAMVAEFVDRYPSRRRMPGDDDGAPYVDLRSTERAEAFA